MPLRDGSGVDLPAPPSGQAWHSLLRELVRRLRAAGVMKRRPLSYAARIAFALGLYALGYVWLLGAPSWPLRLGVIVLVSFAKVQTGMLAHDLEHRAITSNPRAVQALGQLFMTLLNGQAFVQWSEQHGGHHRRMSRDDDPDLQVDYFALYRADALRKRGVARAISSVQHIVIWPLLSLQAFAIKRTTIEFLWKNRRKRHVDRLVLPLHYAMWLGVPALFVGFPGALLNYAVSTVFVGLYLASAFIWNHLGTHALEGDQEAPFLLHQLTATRNLPASGIFTFLFGGLNYHIEHHLVPHASPANLHRARQVVREFCAEHALPFREASYAEAIRGVYAHLKEMALVVRSNGGGEP